MKTNPAEISAKLNEADQEFQREAVEAYRIKITGIIERFRAILIEEDCSIRDWNAIAEVMEKQAMGEFIKMTFNNLYGKQSINSDVKQSMEETNGGAASEKKGTQSEDVSSSVNSSEGRADEGLKTGDSTTDR